MTGISGAMSFPQNQTADRTDCSRALLPEWFAVETVPRYEKRVAAELEKKAVHTFLPLEAHSHQWSDRRRTVHLALFPNYLFVRIPSSAEYRIPVLRTSGVRRFVGASHVGTPVSDTEIESIRLLLQRSIPFRAHPFLSVGQRVRIRGGSLDGMEGVLSGKSDDAKLVVSIQLIQRSLSVHLQGYTVEAA